MPSRPGYAAAATLLAVGFHAGAARAEDCLAGPADDPFPTCFDPGLRVVAGGEAFTTEEGSEPAVSSGVFVRHVVTTDDPGVWWRLEHVMLEGRWRGDDGIDGAVYRGRFIRHSRDGRIVIPTSPPRKIFLPFDLGAETDVLEVASRDAGDRLELGVVRTALFAEVLRSSTFRHRLAIGASARWDVTASVLEGDVGAEEHRVAPFTLGMAAAHFESAAGLTLLDVTAEGGRTWSSEAGWQNAGMVRARAERVLAAVNHDTPVSIYAEGALATPGDGGFVAIGMRFGILASTRAPP